MPAEYLAMPAEWVAALGGVAWASPGLGGLSLLSLGVLLLWGVGFSRDVTAAYSWTEEKLAAASGLAPTLCCRVAVMDRN